MQIEIGYSKPGMLTGKSHWINGGEMSSFV